MKIRSLAIALVCCTMLMACDEPADPVVDDSVITNPPPPISISGAFSLTGSSSYITQAPAHLRAVLSLVNLGAKPDTVSYGGCYAYFRLYATPERTGTPVFDESARTITCTTEARVFVVAPHDSSAILRDYFPNGTLVAPGRYYVSLLVTPNGVAQSMPAGQVDIP